MAGFDPGPIRRLVERICADPDVRLQTLDGLIVRPVQPPAFESLPHPDKVCQAAVKVVQDGGEPFNVSLCDVVLCDVALCDVAPCDESTVVVPEACEAAELVVA